MRVIGIVACNRARYLAKAFGGLMQSLIDLADSGWGFDKLIVSLDPLPSDCFDGETEGVIEEALTMLSESGLIDCQVYYNKCPFGVGGNHLAALQRAFEESRASYVVLIEEDAVLARSALHMADWFWKNHGNPLSPYLLLSMCNHRDFGQGVNPGGLPDDPSAMVESPRITSPFAWAATKWQWPFIKATWNRKQFFPNGWDFSLSYHMRLAKKIAIHPVMSRCANIGEVGLHETPATHAATQGGRRICTEPYFGDYAVVAKMQFDELLKLDDWMESEYRRMFPR